MKLNIIGGIFNGTGYDSHTRQLSTALYNLDIDVRIETPKPPDWSMKVSDNELKMLNKESDDSRTSILIGQPQFSPLSLADNPKKFAQFVIWEGSNIPTYWLKHLQNPQIDLILVPSTHTQQSILNTIEKCKKTGFFKDLEYIDSIKQKLHIVPHGVNTELFKPIPNLKKKIFTFIVSKGWTGTLNDRGGVQYIIEAFLKEFEEDEKVNCIVKINTSYGTPNVDEFLNNKGLKSNKNIMFNLDTVDFKLVPKLYNRGYCFVSATRCDAFNLPCLEAMACGLPVITTNYGGQTDYVNDKNGWLIDYKLEDVTWDIAYEGCKWATPNILDLRKKMRYAFEHKSETEKKGLIAYKDAQRWTWKQSAKKLLEIIENKR